VHILSTIIVVPTYNELENLPMLVEKIFSLPIPDVELMIVDDNSPDGTGELADQYARDTKGRVQVIHRSGKLGLGTAYVAGFKKSLELGADRIVQMDADFSHPPEKILEFMQAIQDHDLVIGSRYVAGGSLDHDWPITRKALSAWGNFYARTILGLKVRDVTAGFRMWRREALMRIPLDRVRSNGYMFQVEMAYLATKLGFTIKEIPIYFAERKYGKSKIDTRIKIEAAVSVWKLPSRYRDIKKVK
jgi:dolichol-phosphate mannosyltransferase